MANTIGVVAIALERIPKETFFRKDPAQKERDQGQHTDRRRSTLQP